MFTISPTPEEFIEMKSRKFEKLENERNAIVHQNNASYVHRVIQAMKRGDDSVILEAMKVKSHYFGGDEETDRLAQMIEKAFPLFAMSTLATDNMISKTSYEIKWFVRELL